MLCVKSLTHSSCSAFKIAGILVNDGGLGFTRGEAGIYFQNLF